MARMTRILTATVATASLVALAGLAQAATIVAGPLAASEDGAADCSVANASASTQNVRVRVIDTSTGTATFDTLDALTPFRATTSRDGVSSGERVLCVVDGNASAVRVTLCIEEDTSGRIHCVQGH